MRRCSQSTESGVLYVISSILKCLFPEACNRGVRQEWDVCARWGAVSSFSFSSASQKASSPANYEQCLPSSLLYVYFSSLSWPGRLLFCRGMRGLRPMLRPRLSFYSEMWPPSWSVQFRRLSLTFVPLQELWVITGASSKALPR